MTGSPAGDHRQPPGEPTDGRLPRDLVLAHLRGEQVGRLPVMPITMQLAGRLAGIPYGEYCGDFRLLARAQETIAARYGFDHVSCISDPTREASDLGAAVAWFADQPPAIDETSALLADAAALARLRPPDPLGGGRMTDRVRAAELLRAGPGRTRLVEGWVEGPCAEAADLRGINALMLDFYDDPAFVADLFDFVTRLAIDFARAQVDAGVDVVGVGDAAASLVGPAIYEEVVLPHEKRLVDAIHAMGAAVRLHICGNMRRSTGAMATLGAEIVDLDSPVPVGEARAAMGADQVLAGNLDPVAEVLRSDPAGIERRLAACHAEAGPRYVVAAGCEVPPATPSANIEAFAAYARATAP